MWCNSSKVMPTCCFVLLRVLLCFVEPILGNLTVRGHSLSQGTWGCRILTLHLNNVAGYTGPLRHNWAPFGSNSIFNLGAFIGNGWRLINELCVCGTPQQRASPAGALVIVNLLFDLPTLPVYCTLLMRSKIVLFAIQDVSRRRYVS